MLNWFILLIAYLPFQIALNPGVGFDLASLRIFILLCFLICLRKIYRWRSKIYNLQFLGLLLFLVLAGFSLIGAENISWGLRKILFFISIFPLYLLLVVLVDNWSKISRVVRVVFVSGGLLALIGLLQFLAQFVFSLEGVYSFWAINVLPIFSGFNLGALILAYPSWLVNIGGKTIMRAFSLFSDPHMLSFYMGLVLPLSVVLFRKSALNFKDVPLQRNVFKIIYALIFITLLFTFTRGAYLAIIITFLLLFFLSWRILKEKRLALLFVLSLLIFIIPITPISDRFYSSFDLTEGSNAGRLAMWQQSGQTGLGYFWLGLGLGNYSLTVDSQFDYRNPITAHNLYLDIFSEMGVLTLLVWLVLILGTIVYLFRVIKNTQIDEVKYLAVSLIGCLVYFFIHSFFETAIYQPSILGLLMIILGLSTYVIQGRTLKC